MRENGPGLNCLSVAKGLKGQRDPRCVPAAGKSSQTWSHCQKAYHFPQGLAFWFTLLPKFEHVLTSKHSLSSRNEQRVKN